MPKKILIYGSILLAFGIFLIIFGKFTYDSVNDTLALYEKNYNDAVARNDFEDAGYWYLQEEVKLKTADNERNLGTNLFIAGLIMFVASFILLIFGVLKKEKISK